MKKIVYTLFLLAIVFACNKDKHISKRLIKGENWEVKEVSVNGMLLNLSGTWKITEDKDIYETVPSATWTMGSEDADFNWQFHEKADKFYLYYDMQCEECENANLDSLDFYAYYLSGQYDVKKRTKKEMIFESASIAHYNGSTVKITIKK